MPKLDIPYAHTGYFSKLICDYLDQKPELQAFYGRFPDRENLKDQLKEKRAHFTKASREVLVKALFKQYEGVDASEATLENINSLADPNSFTITTGHQLNLFTGPSYFLYKIFSVINLCKQMQEADPAHRYVPLYWMATEDHDFDEIDHFTSRGVRYQWKRQASGPVGRLGTQGLDAVLHSLQADWGSSQAAKELIGLFEASYLEHRSLSAATRHLANAIFNKYGLVIIDGDDPALKGLFAPLAEREMLEGLSYEQVTTTTNALNQLGYPGQVHPREINMFYIQDGLRARIVKQDGRYKVLDTDISFDEAALRQELAEHPERFSPNALLRPLYQECILPNLCYIGGGGELAYWFQLKECFNAFDVPFPVVLLRNSLQLITKSQLSKLERLEVDLSDLFQKPEALRSWYTKRLTDLPIDFSKQKALLEEQFKELFDLAKRTDASFVGAVGAQQKKQLNGLKHLERRLLKAEKRRHADKLDRLESLHQRIFPKGHLQERMTNFSELYLEHGSSLLGHIERHTDPLNGAFTVVVV